MKTIAAICAAALTLLIQGQFAGARADSTTTYGQCTSLSVTDYLTSATLQGTSSATWQDLIDGRLNFTTSSTGCVSITFSGNAAVFPNSTDTAGSMHVRTLLDGNRLCVVDGASDIFLLDYYPGGRSANSFTHVCKNVAPGTHTVRIQYYSDSGYTVQMLGHTLSIMHN